MYDISVSTMCIYRDYCVYHYKSTEFVSLYTLDIGLKINIIMIIIKMSTSKTLAAGHRSEMGLYEVPCDETLPGLGIGMTNEVFQIDGRRQDFWEPL